MVVRSTVAPATLVETVRKTILAADPDQPIANVRTLEEAVQRSLSRQRTTLVLLGLFAFVAISLACIGIYGVMSYSVGQRARELSIRSALGAQRRDIIRLVLGGGMKLSIMGIAAGFIAAFFLSRLVENCCLSQDALTRWYSSRLNPSVGNRGRRFDPFFRRCGRHGSIQSCVAP